MTKDDFDEFANILSMTYSLYDKELTKPILQLWWGLMKDQDINHLKTAFNRYIRNSDNGQYIPKPADIFRYLDGSSLDLALLAWTKVDKALRQVGVYHDVVFDDPIIHAVLNDMGGWIALGGKTEDEWVFIGKEFQARYKGYKVKGNGIYPKVLTGIANSKNALSGMQLQPPKYIGDVEKCKNILHSNKQENNFIQLGNNIL